jgi:hypothetical protein
MQSREHVEFDGSLASEHGALGTAPSHGGTPTHRSQSAMTVIADGADLRLEITIYIAMIAAQEEGGLRLRQFFARLQIDWIPHSQECKYEQDRVR